MKIKYILISVILLSCTLYAQVSLNGYVKTDNRVRIQQNGKLTWNENTLGLKFEGSPSSNIHFYSFVRLRGFGFSETMQLSGLQARDKATVQPWGIEFREAYMDIYGFLTDDLDIRIGRQRIVWGTADKLNPTDNLNPDDLEDIFDFGRHLGSNSLMATYYLNDFTFSGVYIPVFTPATLPFGDWAVAFAPPVELPPGTQLASTQEHINLPENKISETSSFGLKASTILLDYDVSLSYYYGRDHLPIFTSVQITPLDTLGNLDLESELSFPRMQIIGADLAGSIGSVGIWAEGALFLPKKVYNFVTITDPEYGTITTPEIILDDNPYFMFVIGGDYTFTNGWYVNAQFLHGFIHERGARNLNDYIVMRFEKNFMNNELKIVPLGIALVVTDWSDISNNYGLAGGPEIDYYPVDALEIAIGAYLLYGKGNNIFSQVKDFDELYLKVRYDF